MKAVDAKILDATHLELSEPLRELPTGRIEVRISRAGDEQGPSDSASSMGGTKAGTRLREREDAWCRSNLEALRRLEGQWVVVEGEEIVVHGEDPTDLVKEARSRGIRTPYVFYVEKPRPGVVRLGL